MLCMLLKTIRFKDFDEQWVTLEAETVIYVDQTESIAYEFERDLHFTVERNEYTVMD